MVYENQKEEFSVNKRAFFVLLTVLIFTVCSVAYGTTVTVYGTSTGGSDCTAILIYTGSYARAETHSDEYGKLEAKATFYYTKPNGTADHSSKSASASNVLHVYTSAAEGTSGSTGTAAVSTHRYTSTTYGGWTKTIERSI